MAVASLVLGIISIPTLGLALVGAVVGLILGSIALRKANRDPGIYGGRGLAIGGIVASCASLSITVMMGAVAAIAIPNLLKSAWRCPTPFAAYGRANQMTREVFAVEAVKDIGKAQVLYSVTKGRGRFTDLRTLAAFGMIDPLVGSGEWGGYIFSTTPVIAEGQPAMFDTTARPISTGTFGAGNRSFYSNETVVIWEAEGEDPPHASPSDRTPTSGSVFSGPANPGLAPRVIRN
jgi:hypothetical protein